MEKIIDVDGITCDHCVATIKTAIESMSGIIRGNVDIQKKQVIVRVVKPMWWGPAGKIPPNPPVRWGYRRLCRSRLNC